MTTASSRDGQAVRLAEPGLPPLGSAELLAVIERTADRLDAALDEPASWQDFALEALAELGQVLEAAR